MNDMAQQMLEVLGRPTGLGIFSRSFVEPGKGRTRQWFSLASGLASLQYKVEYRTRFEEVPEWVLLCHPDHQIGLCRLALSGNRPLPPDRPPAHAGGSRPQGQ